IFIEDPVTNKEELLDIYSSEKIPESSLWYKSGCSVEFDMREEDFQMYLDKFTLRVPGAFFSTLKNIKFHCQSEAADSDN
ncbi:MAG: hypothetical protein JXR91_02300, partial [Deltaproteobacteria bacterium]|nr:hypothetical protein [Deltaproteobacteria bacterium]